jgi:hypothetical protein
MPQCITENPTSLDVESLDEANDYVVRVNTTTPTIRITFTPPRTALSVGSVDSVTVTIFSGSGPLPDSGADWVEFTTSEVGTTYNVAVAYTLPPRADSEDDAGPPLYVPTKTPKFKPQPTCPTL